MSINSLVSFIIIFCCVSHQLMPAAHAKDVAVDETGNDSYLNSMSRKPVGSSTGSLVDELYAEGLHRNRAMFFGGWHKSLYGFRDARYREDDKGDYIKTDAYHGGLELFFTDFSSQHPKLKDLRAGININFFYRKEMDQVELFAVPLHGIQAETIPSRNEERVSLFKLIPGFFIGVDKKWVGFDIGLTSIFSGYEEKYREKIDSSSDPSSPQYNKVDGRGYVWKDSTIRMNFQLRLGLENNAHIMMSLFWGNYDPDYGIFMLALQFPVSSFLVVKAGGYLYKTQSAFLEPVVTFSGISIGLRGGSIINYHDDKFDRVGVQDGLFAALSLSYNW